MGGMINENKKSFNGCHNDSRFLCSNVLISKADFSNEYAKDDYRRQPVIDIYGEEVAKPIANFRIIRMRNGEIKDMLESYYDNDLSAEFPSMQCYVGDTIVFEDLSKAKNNANIKTWDFNITVCLATAITSIIITYWSQVNLN